MSKFNSLRSMQVTKTSTAEYTMHDILVNGRHPTLVVRYAGETNQGYFNAQLRRAGKARKALARGQISAAMIADNRREDRELFPKYVIVGWRDVVGDDGKELPFSAEDCADFVDALPDWVFDDVRGYASDPANFVDAVDADEAEEQGKN